MKLTDYGISLKIGERFFSIEEALSYLDNRRGKWTWYYIYEHGILATESLKIQEVKSFLASSLGPGTKGSGTANADGSFRVFPGPRD